MSIVRKIQRRILKSEIGNNDISESWYHLQLSKYGLERYCSIQNLNRKILEIKKKKKRRGGCKYTITENGITLV